MVKGYIILYPILGFFWCLLHLIVTLVHLWSYLARQIQFLITSSGFLSKYQNLNLEKLKYLAIVIDSEEAKNKRQINQLLLWLSNIGIKYVILYDIEGVLKKSNIADEKTLKRSIEMKSLEFDDRNVPSNLDLHGLKIEIISYIDGKEAIVKATNYLYSNYSNSNKDEIETLDITETDLSNTLKSIGHGGPEPELLLVYGPARCHLSFPAWRLRYTEIVHMGPLKMMKYSATVKAICDFSKKHQNYGK